VKSGQLIGQNVITSKGIYNGSSRKGIDQLEISPKGNVAKKALKNAETSIGALLRHHLNVNSTKTGQDFGKSQKTDIRKS